MRLNRIALVALVAISAVGVAACTASSPAPSTASPSPSAAATASSSASPVRPTPTDSEGIIQHVQLRAVLSTTTPTAAECAATFLAELGTVTTACSTDAKTAYTLGPAVVSGAIAADFAEVDATRPTREIDINVGPINVGSLRTPEDLARAAAFSRATTVLAAKEPPANEVAIYKDGVVLIAVPVTAPITTGTLVLKLDTVGEWDSLTSALGM